MECQDIQQHIQPLDMLQENVIHFIDDDNTYILGSADGFPDDLLNISGTDSNQSSSMFNGNYLLTEDGQTILLPSVEDNVQYFIEEETFATAVDQNATLVQSQSELFQIVDEEQQTNPILYYTEDENGIRALTSEEMEQLQLVPQENISLENDPDGNIEFTELVQNDLEYSHEVKMEEEYAIIGSLRGQMCTSKSEPRSIQVRKDLGQADPSKITGRNLITGQVVSLDNYLEKLKQKERKGRSKAAKKTAAKHKGIEDLLDRTISLGTTKTGKKIVGKIILVKRKSEEIIQNDENDIVQDPVVPNQESAIIESEMHETSIQDPPLPKYSPKRLLLLNHPADSLALDHIAKTLSGVVAMESIRKKLLEVNVFVKFVEKKHCDLTASPSKNITYSYGRMVKRDENVGIGTTDEEEQLEGLDGREKWIYVPFDMDEYSMDVERTGKAGNFFHLCTTTVTIVMTRTRSGKKSVRVNLNSTAQHLCPVCLHQQQGAGALQQHLNAAHRPWAQLQLQQQQQQVDVAVGQKKNATQQSRSTERRFACNVCLRMFSRHSNLLRHMDIHKGAVYKCGICSCSYNFPSSLTRHMVQVHMRPQ